MSSSAMSFLSKPPIVKLVNTFTKPFDTAVAAARTCYSNRGIITPEEVRGDGAASEDEKKSSRSRRDALAKSIYEAGHHTTFQHAHLQFALDRVSRQFIWSFLHSHPFYNSEQVSQRYTKAKPENVLVPALTGPALTVYEETVSAQMKGYDSLTNALIEPAKQHFFARFPGRMKKADSYKVAVRRKAREIARYVLPVASFAYLYHTISTITLLRYWRLCQQADVPTETRAVVEAMMGELLQYDPDFATLVGDPLPLEATPEYAAFQNSPDLDQRDVHAAFLREFDAGFGSNRHAVLISAKPENEQIVAAAVREVLGVPISAMSDKEALTLVLDPASNGLYSESLNLNTLSKLSRTLVHASYTFRKRLSHAADSQDQRHRMTPASRPVLAAHAIDEPDYITPALIAQSDKASALYQDIMSMSWEAIGKLRRMGVENEWALYLLPNAVTIRFSESADYLNLHHKHAMRLCYLAQEEIFQASVEEALAVKKVDPTLGRFLLPPCGHRKLASTTPYCPEGDRYCGVPVWTLELEDYKRVI